MKLTLDFTVPRVPNFIRTRFEDGYVAIERLTDDELREVGKEWTEALIEHAKKRRAALAARIFAGTSTLTAGRLNNCLNGSALSSPEGQTEKR